MSTIDQLVLNQLQIQIEPERAFEEANLLKFRPLSVVRRVHLPAVVSYASSFASIHEKVADM